MRPLISVIVTVYNLEPYISQCLESLVNQGTNDYEVVVVDNGSSDRSAEICCAFEKRYPEKFHVILLDSPSVMHRAHQKGVDEARGQYIQIVDGDDYLREGYLCEAEKIIISKHPDVIIGRYISFSEGKALPLSDTELEKEAIDDRKPEEVMAYLRTKSNFHLAFWRYIFKKKIIKNFRLFESSLTENRIFPLFDAVVTFRILLSGNCFALMEQPMYFYRHRVNSMTGADEKRYLWNFQGFSEFIILLGRGLYSGEIRSLILDKLCQEIKLCIGISDKWTANNFSSAAAIQRQIEPYMHFLTDNGVPGLLKEYVEFLNKNSAESESLALYFENKRFSIIRRVSERAPKQIYIFPCGRLARDVQRWLYESGLMHISFVDNNPDMESLDIQGSKCLSAKCLISADEDAIVLIATIYSLLDLELYRQCLNLGIPEKNIMFLFD